MPIGAAPAALRSNTDASVAAAPQGAEKAPARDGFAMLADLARSALEAAAEAMVAAEPAPPTADDLRSAAEIPPNAPATSGSAPPEIAPTAPTMADPIDPGSEHLQPPAQTPETPADANCPGLHHFAIVDAHNVETTHPDWAISSTTGRVMPAPGAAACAAGRLTIRVTAPSGAIWVESIPTAERATIVPPPPPAQVAAKPAATRGLAHRLPPSALFAVDGAYRANDASDPLDIEALGPVAYDMLAHLHVGDDGVVGLAPFTEPEDDAATDIVLVDDWGLDAHIGPPPQHWSLHPGGLSERGLDQPAARNRGGVAITKLDLRAAITTTPRVRAIPEAQTAPAIPTPAAPVADDPFDLPDLDGIPLDFDLDSALDDQPTPNFTMDWGRALATGDAR
jgi:hypothetical protein